MRSKKPKRGAPGICESGFLLCLAMDVLHRKGIQLLFNIHLTDEFIMYPSPNDRPDDAGTTGLITGVTAMSWRTWLTGRSYLTTIKYLH
jgi:hypothetical protein